tara:strand:- start:485 stop:1309 length:825 start_codon:yes stop_codon:yes gene_type:complete
MTRAIGLVCRAGERIIVPELGKEHPSGRVHKVYLGGNTSDTDVVLDLKKTNGTDGFRMLQAGTMYCSSIEPMTTNSQIGSGLPFQDIRTKKLTFDDGTFMTSAGGMSLVATYVIPSGPGFVTPDLITAGALGEVGRWKIVVSNIKTDALVGFNTFYTQAGGQQLDGQQNGYNWSNGMAATNSAVTYPGLPIELNESVDSVLPNLHNQLEIDITQKTGDAGFATSKFAYTNTTGQFRVATRHFQTQPSRDIAGFNIRGSGPSNMQGTIYVYKYSS